MVSAPLGTYYASLNLIFRGMCLLSFRRVVPNRRELTLCCSGSTTWAGASAAIVANLVLVGYVLVAMAEDQGEPGQAQEGKSEGKKDQ